MGKAKEKPGMEESWFTVWRRASKIEAASKEENTIKNFEDGNPIIGQKINLIQL